MYTPSYMCIRFIVVCMWQNAALFGESRGPAAGCTIDGCPTGIMRDEAVI